jgi:hypothetical protein
MNCRQLLTAYEQQVSKHQWADHLTLQAMPYSAKQKDIDRSAGITCVNDMLECRGSSCSLPACPVSLVCSCLAPQNHAWSLCSSSEMLTQYLLPVP